MSKKENEAKPYVVPPDGSLGLLAMGYRGFVAWQEAKKKFKENNPQRGHEQKK